MLSQLHNPASVETREDRLLCYFLTIWLINFNDPSGVVRKQRGLSGVAASHAICGPGVYERAILTFRKMAHRNASPIMGVGNWERFAAKQDFG